MIILSAITLVALTVSQPKPPTLIDEINTFRVVNHLPVVTVKKEACEFAKIRAKEANTTFSHAAFFKRKKQLDKTGYYWYENLAQNYKTNKEVIEAWKKSKTHRKILLDNMQYACTARYGKTWALAGMEKI